MNAARVMMYSTKSCPYCAWARELLARKRLPFEDIDVGADPARRAEMHGRSGRYTVPQVFIGSTHVGGYEELHALDSDGRLDALLGLGS
ncbi:MAG: glutaredoxin 3 [Steroidobacteraceae bacterium]